MIALSAESLVLCYVVVFLAGVLILWISSHWFQKHKNSTQRQTRVRCLLCAMEYEDASLVQLPECPRCGSKNERP